MTRVDTLSDKVSTDVRAHFLRRGASLAAFCKNMGMLVRQLRSRLQVAVLAPNQALLSAISWRTSGNTRRYANPAAPAFSSDFAKCVGIDVRGARIAFKRASEGKAWRGHHLPVGAHPGQRGGSSGVAWGLAVDAASANLRALLKLTETLPSMPVHRRLKARPDEGHCSVVDKQRIIAPIVAHPKGSHDRAAAVLTAARQQHRERDGWDKFGGRTMRVWVQTSEAKAGRDRAHAPFGRSRCEAAKASSGGAVPLDGSPCVPVFRNRVSGIGFCGHPVRLSGLP